MEFHYLVTLPHFGEMEASSPPGWKTLYNRKAWGGFWSPLHPKTRKVTKSAEFHGFRDFQEFPRILQKSTVFCENVALAAGRPSKTTPKRQVILGFERRERRGRRFRAKSENKKNHEITKVS